MTPLLIIGAGKIGASLARLLADCGDYAVTVGDRDAEALIRLSQHCEVQTRVLNVRDPVALAEAMQGQHAVISAASFDVNTRIARAALGAGISYFDLTEDVATTQAIRRMAASSRAGQVFMPQCGLAPGFIGILAADIASRFSEIDTVKMRVGALPQYPDNRIKYNLTWSTDGLINEYCNACEAIRHGRLTTVHALEGLEHFALDGLEYEAFNTSGGLGTLCETLAGQVQEMDYKTVRYPGHRDLIDFLVNGLRLGRDRAHRQMLKKILEEAVPITLQDLVLVVVSVSGQLDGQFRQISDARKIYHSSYHGQPWSAIQLTTAASAAAVIDLHLAGQLPDTGFIRQEDVRLMDFLANRFGRHYDVPRLAEEIPV
ncbi:saccharopine dehydrogenase family protein [Chitinilyticum piscinae]|uniref:Saccharopine dehydrogenase NADP-binding domain-containing protein n=1 Tax=Chitinilyticum piscinae TaxID=2866724 RepID=A0A8J7FH69_9NEIS|nr:saccharopine dehydrogenase C-terminal domain-containing protein [Chitinilyticum piscinae]MBE9609378.1 saccharopine dehydrogenase NADP-binding domain-containing protein [Chitinilyticum piscinae]